MFFWCVKEDIYVQDWTYDDYIKNGFTSDNIILTFRSEIEEVE